jgi:catechol 2,3-dioxygenase-like lactoylglutathione lyase family enzyme
MNIPVRDAVSSQLELRAVLLFVDDFQAQMTFYTDVVGFEVMDVESGVGYVRLRDWVMLSTGAGSLFELFDRSTHGSPFSFANGAGNAVPAFEVRDVMAAWDRLTDAKVTTLIDPQERDWGTFFFFEDPEGNPLQVYELKEGTVS